MTVATMIRIRAPSRQARRTLDFAIFRQYSTIMSRRESYATTAATSSSQGPYGAVVVGGGPAGITVIGNLLEQRQQRLLWVDPAFRAGRVNAAYREVPSNTAVALFLQFAQAVEPFQKIVDATPEPNAVSVLRSLPQDKGCELSKAADMCLMLSEGLAKHEQVHQQLGKVTAATFDKTANQWTVSLENALSPVVASNVVLCTGSSPISSPLPIMDRMQDLKMNAIHLDTALAPSKLQTILDPSSPATVAVIGASHSAILVLRNLYNIANTSHPNLRIKWFTRNKLRYAVKMDGWILRDNTGLKGEAAEWARQNLEDGGVFEKSPVSRFVKKIWTEKGKEDATYQVELPGCTHMVQAIGYKQDPIPDLSITEGPGAPTEPLTVVYEPLSGRFVKSVPIGSAAVSTSSTASATTAQSADDYMEFVPGLFGAGIAYPERVTDPYGNVEYAVGFWKFMRFLKRAVPEWLSQR
ncbi:pyridine nucleotide-disulfide oxidoreductase-domain-containing protein [Phyllosticta citricarpa]|uniref:Pyridine nucleotide-disulfide oxidoreductase-domain-containing protein n=2 Tax=Phyllosticta TaxID=121621 RepID=A0ABR1MI36_9PEZI